MDMLYLSLVFCIVIHVISVIAKVQPVQTVTNLHFAKIIWRMNMSQKYKGNE